MEEKILSLYACGMSQRDIAEQIKNLYDIEISPELISKISEKILPEVTAWQNRPLETSFTPRVLSSFNIFSQNLTLSFSPIQIPRISF